MERRAAGEIFCGGGAGLKGDAPLPIKQETKPNQTHSGMSPLPLSAIYRSALRGPSGMVRSMNWSNKGTVNAVSPWAGL